MASVPRVLIVDQDPEARYGARQLVEQAGFQAGGDAGLGTEAVAQAAELKPEVVLFGLKEPMARAIQTVEAIVHDLPGTPIITYAASSDLQTVRQAMLAGARDFLQAPLKADELRRSLTAALESEERRKLRSDDAAVLGPRGSVITVFGAKGGAGKTTIATNLAVALATQGDQSVVLVDADDSFGDAATILGLGPGPSVTDALREPGPMDSVASQRYLTPHESGVAVMQGPASPFEWRDISGDRLKEALAELSRQFDVVLVDTGSTLSEVSLAALQAASLVLWVTTPDYASAHDSVRALQVLSTIPIDNDRVRLVLNVNTPELDVSPASIETALGRPIFWTIPYDRQVRRSAQIGRTVVEADPGSVAARGFWDLATVLSGGSPVPRKKSILARLLNGRRRAAGASRQEARA